jgi:hypothetical protein
MAVTKRKRPLPVVIEEEKKNILSHDEHIAVETRPLQVQNAKLLMAIEEQSLANMILELKLLEQKIEKQRNKVGECSLKYSQEKSLYAAIVSDIMKNHGLKDEKFSYNNNTCEIIL